MTEAELSRFYAVAREPLPEVVFDEKDDQGNVCYDRCAYYRQFSISDDDVSHYDRIQDSLTELFYTGDCSMRESGKQSALKPHTLEAARRLGDKIMSQSKTSSFSGQHREEVRLGHSHQQPRFGIGSERFCWRLSAPGLEFGT